MDSRVRLLNNPDRIQSAALNLMIQQAKGDILVRADAHCIYSMDYVEACVKTMLRTDCVCVGGAQRFIAQNHVQAGISLAVRSFIGSGNAKYRDQTYSGYADTVFLGCFRRELFDTIGLFRTDVHPNEDTELNMRILKHDPKGIYISDQIQVWYFPRMSVKSLWIQYFKYGEGVVKTSKFHGLTFGRRSTIPIKTVLLLLIGLIMEQHFTGSAVYTILSITTLILVIFLASLNITVLTKDEFNTTIWKSEMPPPGLMKRLGWTTLVAILMNIAHAIGFASKWIRGLFHAS